MTIAPEVTYQIICSHVDFLLEDMCEESLLELAGLYLINQYSADPEELGENILYNNDGDPEEAISQVASYLQTEERDGAVAQKLAEEFAATYLTSLAE